MAVTTAHAHEEHHDDVSPTRRLYMNRMGLWLFLISESFLFGGILVSRFYLWGATRPQLDQALGLAVTVILLISSFFANRAEVAIKYDDHKTFFRSILMTILLGVLFLAGVVGMEWRTAPVTPMIDGELNVYGAILFFMTGMHAFHVLTGVVILAIIARLGRRGHFHSKNFWGVEAAVIYWHFVDVVWVFFYPALYLIGSPIGPGH
ncbi:MAG TPA: heme-copper oxidase subunit III [Anaerolineae bacterium]|nr:heme-copper oxidase subunit III [Anaerolineae bacterium]